MRSFHYEVTGGRMLYVMAIGTVSTLEALNGPMRAEADWPSLHLAANMLQRIRGTLKRRGDIKKP